MFSSQIKWLSTYFVNTPFSRLGISIDLRVCLFMRKPHNQIDYIIGTMGPNVFLSPPFFLQSVILFQCKLFTRLSVTAVDSK